MVEEPRDEASRNHGPALLTFGLAYAVLHHLGLLPDGLGQATRGTRWVDWLDLLVPYAVVGSALWVAVAAPLDRRWWPALAVGAIAYVSGHGIHLAANSIANTAPSDASAQSAYIWDEVVGLVI